MRGREAEHLRQPKDNPFAATSLRSSITISSMNHDSRVHSTFFVQEGLSVGVQSNLKKLTFPQLNPSRLPPPPQHRDDV